MQTPSPPADRTPPRRAWPRRPGVTWDRTVLYVAPVAAIALYGALWIALHTGGERNSTHTFFQSLALAESVVALLLRRRKPVGALAGILAAYMLFSLDPLLLPAVLLALLNVAMMRDRRTAALAAAATAAATAVWPDIRGYAVSIAGYSLPRLAAVGVVVAAGMYLRERRNRRAVQPVEEFAGVRAAVARDRGDHDDC